ncbi:MAG TPA: tyrosine-type recombinase/integrase [Armatimonadota bacterium]|nr:tyrosine-type recombinase/integrase [Armatimonadota bacterium]
MTTALTLPGIDRAAAEPTIGREFLDSQLSKGTARVYRGTLEQFFGVACEELTVEDLRMVTPGRVIAWRNELMQEQASATVARKVSTVRGLFRYAVALGLVADNPARPELVRSPRVSPESQTCGLSNREVRALLDSIVGEDLTTLRDRAMIELALRTGLRRAEIVAASRSDLGTDNGHRVLMVTGKGGERQSVKLTVPAGRAIDTYLAARTDDSPALFISHAGNGTAGGRLSTQGVYERVRRHVAAAGIAKTISPHSLRHTFVTLALDGGATVRQVQIAARHKDPKTTIRYDRHRKNLDDHASDYLHF